MEENRVLLSLLRNPKAIENKITTFQWIIDESGISNRNRCRAILSNLVKQGFIREEPENWKVGQKKLFSLTDRGKSIGIQKAAADINESMDILEGLSSGVDPAQFREYVKSN